MQWLGNVDDRVRGFWQQRAAETMARGQKSYADEMIGRATGQGADLDGVAKALAGRTGRDLSEYQTGGQFDMTGMGDTQLRQLFEDTYAQKPGLRVRAESILGNTGAKARVGQAGLYAAMGGGLTMGLTAAGQGLFALTQYLAQGQDSAIKRDQELV